MVPQYARDSLGLSANWVYAAFLVSSIASGALLLPFGKVADVRGRRPVIAFGLIAGAVGFLLLPTLLSAAGLLIAMTLLGVAAAADAVAPVPSWATSSPAVVAPSSPRSRWRGTSGPCSARSSLAGSPIRAATSELRGRRGGLRGALGGGRGRPGDAGPHRARGAPARLAQPAVQDAPGPRNGSGGATPRKEITALSSQKSPSVPYISY